MLHKLISHSEPISSTTATDKLWDALEQHYEKNAKEKLIRASINAGANLASFNQSGLTPIQFAAYKKDWQTVITIAEMKNTDSTDSYRYGIALLESVKAHALNAAEKLLTAKTSVERIKDYLINPAEHFAKLIDATSLNLYQTVKMLLEAKVPTFINGSNYTSCLHAAILNSDDLKLIELIVQYSDINQTSFRGNTALHHAVLTDEPKLVELLLAHGADLTIKNQDNKTPLQLLIFYKCWDCLKPLIDAQKYPEAFKDLEFYKSALLDCLNDSHLHVKAFDMLLHARMNNELEQTELNRFIKISMHNLIKNHRYAREPLALLPLVMRGGRSFKDAFNNQNFMIFINTESFIKRLSDKEALDRLLCLLLVQKYLPSDKICKQLAIAKPALYSRIMELSTKDPHTLGLMLLEAAVDESNGLGKLIHYQQGLLKSETAKKIHKEIDKRKKEMKQAENNSTPSQVASMQMWQLPKAPEPKIAAKLERIEDKAFTL